MKSERRKENEDERLKAAEQRLIATGALVNVASPRLNAAEQQVNLLRKVNSSRAAG